MESDPPFRLSFTKSTKRYKRRKVKRSNRQSANRKRRRGRFYYTSSRKRFYSVKMKDEQPYRPADEYLGENSMFLNVEDNLKETVKIAPVPVDIIRSATEIPVLFNKFAYDITAPNSVLDSYITSKSFDIEKIKKMPLALKALLCSRSDAANNNILSSDTDLLVDPEYKILSQVVFQTSQRIEVLSGYARDMNNEPMLSTPIWQPINPSLIKESDTVICRMVYEEFPEMGLKTPEDFKLPVLNEVFIISSKDITKIPSVTATSDSPVEKINVNTKNELSRNIKYATSNIVSQSPEKNSIEKNLENKKAMNKISTSTSSNTGVY